MQRAILCSPKYKMLHIRIKKCSATNWFDHLQMKITKPNIGFGIFWRKKGETKIGLCIPK